MKSPFGRIEEDNSSHHFQKELGALIRVIKPKIVVETGLHQGLSTEYILQALDAIGDGHLYSIDPLDPNHTANGMNWSPNFMLENPIVHPRWTWLREKSQDCLERLFKEVGQFDVFIHDSDHCYVVQTFEYESAWRMVRPGGVIVSDDVTWGDPPHNAWPEFLKRHKIELEQTVGAAHYVVRQ